MTPEQQRAAISSGVEQLRQQLPEAAISSMANLLAELQRWSGKVNLTAIRDPAAMVSGHIIDSLSVRPYLHGERIIDIGTGAGFPGIPLAIAEPQRHFTLLDSNGKKIAFVRHIIAELGLDNAIAIKARAEDYAPEQRFDTVLARALGPIANLAALSEPLIGDNGVLVAQKGKYPAEELDGLEMEPGRWEYTVTEVTVPGLEQHERRIVCLTKAVTA